MPPKKQEEESSAPAVTWTILPIVFNSSLALDSLRKPVNLKKVIDLPKLIELLKDKGIEKYLEEGKLTSEGELFVSEHLNSTGQ